MNAADIREVVLKINDADVKKRMDNLQKQFENATREKERLEKKSILSPRETKQLKDFSLQVDSCRTQMEKMRATGEKVGKTLSNLAKSSINDLKNTIKSLEKELYSGKISRGTKDWERYTRALKDARTELKKVQKEQYATTKALSTTLKAWGHSLVGITTVATQAIMALTGIRQTILGAVNAYAEMEEHMSQVRKYTGMTTEEVHKLNEELKGMDTRTSRERLNDLAGDAGRLGIQGKKAVLDFVQAADQINVALGEDLGEDGVKNIGKLAQLFGDADKMGLKQAMLSTGSVINELAQSSSAAEGYIMNFTARLAGVGKQANMSQAQVMAFASILDQGMIRCERGATALQNVITAMYRQPQKMAKVAGLDVKQFSETLKKDGNAALLMFIEALHKAGKMDVLAPMLKEMKLSGSGVTATISTLANNLDRLKATQEQATQAFKDGTSVTNEFNIQNNTVQAGLEKAKKQFHEVVVELGKKLQPAVKYLISGTSVGIKALGGIINFIGKNIGAITRLALAIGQLTIAWNLQRIGILAYNAAAKVELGLTKSAIFLTKTATVAKNALALVYARLKGNIIGVTRAQIALNSVMGKNPFVKILSIILAIGTTVYTVFSNLLSKTKELTAVEKAQIQAEKDLREIALEANKAIGDKTAKIRLLTAIIHDNNRTLNERKRAIETLKAIVPGYNAEISKEGKVVRENTKAINDYIDALKRQAMMKAIQGKMESIAGEIADAMLAKRGWMGGLSRIKDEISLFKQENAAFLMARKEIKDKGYRLDDYGASAMVMKRYGLSMDDYLKASRKLSDLLERQSTNRSKIRQYQALIEVLNGRTDTLTKVWTDMGNNLDELLNSLGETSGSGVVGGAADSEEDPEGYYFDDEGGKTSKEEQARRKAARAADVKIEQEAKEALRKIEDDFVTSGRTDYENYLKERNAKEVEYLQKRRDCWEKSDNEWVKYHEQAEEKKASLDKELNAWSLKDIDRFYAERLAKAKRDHILSTKTDEEKQNELDRIELEHLQKRAKYLREHGGTAQEVTEAEIKVQELANQQKLQLEIRQQERIKQLKEEYTKKTAKEIFDLEMELLNKLFPEKADRETELYKKMLAGINNKFLTGQVTEKDNSSRESKEAAQKALKLAGYEDDKWNQGKNYGASGIAGALVDVGQSVNAINRAKETYMKLEELRKNNQISQEQYAAAKEELDQQSFDRFIGMAQAAYAAVSEMMNSYTSLMTASRDAEIAKVEERYDREIEAAGSSTAKGKKLEEQKQAAVAKIKNRYNKRMMVMEVAQAMAQTAMNALMAYGSVVKIPVVGPALAAAAAAAATAAGLIQVAAIKKQHEAESAGYYEGGFTGGTRYKRQAGIVHEGEFVANHKAVANPNVAPMLRLIDQAQRNNTIGSLTAEDVSRALPMTAASSAASPMAKQQPVVIHETRRTSEALERLNDQMDRGIPAFVTIDGPQGLARQWKHYQELLKNK